MEKGVEIEQKHSKLVCDALKKRRRKS